MSSSEELEQIEAQYPGVTKNIEQIARRPLLTEKDFYAMFCKLRAVWPDMKTVAMAFPSEEPEQLEKWEKRRLREIAKEGKV